MFSVPKQNVFEDPALEEARKYSLHLNADMSKMAAYPSTELRPELLINQYPALNVIDADPYRLSSQMAVGNIN